MSDACCSRSALGSRLGTLPGVACQSVNLGIHPEVIRQMSEVHTEGAARRGCDVNTMQPRNAVK